ncbi:alpha/beta hydrolase [Bacillus taeanensis]|uniref:Alpha/beta hydrolase n=1 Tax=Bacillus taeanensis TaxID=273032 RepID=A0A366XXE1_9BACI|nr:alpha/beta hydrolase [Bacillus taeanensis]RBW71060.1 alpha/beta hydrolase [Bacillus taeanensis]
MGIQQRFFQIDSQWNVIHIPERPNGFAIFLFGDTTHYVDDKSSLWTQSNTRSRFLYSLLTQGYTVFYSHLHGRHWGSSAAVSLAKSVYQVVMRKEILNPNIHILAEGMGALVALSLMEKESYIRSAAMINPCLDLKKHFNNERDNKLFYKRFKKELAKAYHINIVEVETLIEKWNELESCKTKVPTKIWHSPNGVSYSVEDHSRKYEERRKKQKSDISIVLPLNERSFSFNEALCRFYQQNEKMI